MGEFEVSTVDNLPLSRELLFSDTLVGFFSPSCQPCKEKLPKFIDYARKMPEGRNQVIAAVVGNHDNAHGMVEQLRDVAQVILQVDNQDNFGSAFEIMAFPTVLKVRREDNGRLVITDDQVDLSQSAISA
ncbi:thioredoxin-like domain-containing protein [Streptosporangium sp. NPDC051022]|uniref:thioredoxin-like domain-containing protein n=1 Tax=Streptosporangium sp. NPDC051022 TaxID=3155752 RepID=UPI003430348D